MCAICALFFTIYEILANQINAKSSTLKMINVKKEQTGFTPFESGRFSNAFIPKLKMRHLAIDGINTPESKRFEILVFSLYTAMTACELKR